MAEMTIRLRVNPLTGKKDIVIALDSDDDSLPHEHEHLHRQLVEKLIHGGLVGEHEAGSLIIERLEEEKARPKLPLSVTRRINVKAWLSEGGGKLAVGSWQLAVGSCQWAVASGQAS